MRKQDELNTIIKKLAQDIQELKVKQPIAGDSWIPYRYADTVSVPALSTRFLVFTQNDTRTRAVVKIGQQLGLDLYSTGMRSQNGVSVFTLVNGNTTDPRDFDYVLSSTQEGVVTVVSSPPF